MKRLILIICLLASLIAIRPVSAQAQPVVVRVNPKSSLIAFNQITAVAVEVVEVVEVYGVDITMTFDPAVLEVVDADPGLDGIQLSLGKFLDPGFVIINEADNDAGVLRLAMAQLYPSTPKSGTGNLIVINFRGKVIGAETDLDLVSVKMARNNGSPIENTTQPGVAEVVEDIPGPTYTPIPTQGAGTPLPTATKKSASAPTQTPQPATSATPKPATETDTAGQLDQPADISTATATVETKKTEIQNTPTFTHTASAENDNMVAEGSSPPEEEEQQTLADIDGAQIPVQTITETTYPIGLFLAVGLLGILVGGGMVYFLGIRRRDDEK